MNKTIHLEVTATRDYCGGANPGEEMLQEYRQPRPYQGQIYVHSSREREDEGIALTVSDGRATVKGLTKGEYFLYFDKKINEEDIKNNVKFKGLNVDPECLLFENRKALAEFAVNEETKTLQFELHKVCNPCLPPAP